jgi:GAF domain-containing protein
MLLAATVVGLLAAVAGTYDAYVYEQHWIIPLYWVAYGLVVVLFVWKRAPYALGAGAVATLVYILGFTQLLEDGVGGSAQLFLLTVPFLAGVFWGRRVSIPALALVTMTMAGFGVVFSTGLLVIPENPTAAEPSRWIAGTLVLLLMGVLMTVSLDFLISRLTSALGESRRLVQALEEQRSQLEEQVAERTVDLSRRGAQLEAAAQVAREAAGIRDMEQLLQETVKLVSDRFGFDHTGLFLLDEAGEYAVLRAASSEGGRRMLARGHRLRVGQEGIVGYVTEAKRPRVALDVGEDAVFFDNPDLPNTRSEAALPLLVGQEVFGALDVQSIEREAFGEADLTVLQTLADQIAIAISNSRLVQRVQESLEIERRAYGQMSMEAWRNLIRSGIGPGRRYDPQRILPDRSVRGTETVQAETEGRPVAGQAGPAMAIPLKVREQVIGVLDAYKPSGAGDWTDGEMVLFQALVDQLGVALDGARLYQDAQLRATQDRVLGEVAGRMRETLDMDEVVRTAVREIGEALGIAEVEVRMGAGPDQAPTTGSDHSGDGSGAGTTDTHRRGDLA